MNFLTSKKENISAETLKNNVIVKLRWVSKFELKLRKEF